MPKSATNQHKNKKQLTILFVAWFLYSAGMLGYMAVHDTTPPHCFISVNEKSL